MNYKNHNLAPKKFALKAGMEILAAVCGEEGRGRTRGLLTCHKELERGELVSLGQTRTGKPRISSPITAAPTIGWVARVNAETAYQRGLNVSHRVWVGEPTKLAYGWHAWGDAGRIGGYEDSIWALPYGAILYHGGRYSQKVYFSTPEALHIVEYEKWEDFLDTYEGNIELSTIEDPKRGEVQVPILL